MGGRPVLAVKNAGTVSPMDPLRRFYVRDPLIVAVNCAALVESLLRAIQERAIERVGAAGRTRRGRLQEQ